MGQHKTHQSLGTPKEASNELDDMGVVPQHFKAPLQIADVYTVDAHYSEPSFQGRDMHIAVKDVTLTPDHPGTGGKIVNIAEGVLVFEGVSSSVRQVREYLNDPRNEAPTAEGRLKSTQFGPPAREKDPAVEETPSARTQTYCLEGGALCRGSREFGVEEWKIEAERAFIQVVRLRSSRS